MSKFIFSAVAALSLVAFASVSADAGGCGSGYKKNYGHNYGHNYNYRRPVYHKTYTKPIVHERVVEKPVIREVVVEKPIIKEVIVEKPVIKEVIVEKPVVKEVVVAKPVVHETIVEKPAPPLPSLGFFGVICPEGMLVKEVRPNTEACRLGLQPGDVIKSFDDMRILCEDDWVISLQRAGDVACLKVIPCGEHALVEMHAQLATGFAY
ncbi:signal protein PDZ [Rubinisphaera sp. JC750]|uniref:signal protein PDZ n=1 Tax=Rubinisphaera sp. JC750 TaxID=2898658 RepID=UPI001F3B3741|nr:signal protein PDZ [Rubinisphaera sp. JC750]